MSVIDDPGGRPDRPLTVNMIRETLDGQSAGRHGRQIISGSVSFMASLTQRACHVTGQRITEG